MASRRVLKVASAIREVVSMAILTDLRDPRVEHVTVTRVEVTGDLREAKVYVSIMGDEKKQNLCLHGLKNSAGYLQQKVSNRVELRYTPKLNFMLDEGVKNAAEVARILGEVLPEEASETEPSENAPSETEATESSLADGDNDVPNTDAELN